MRRVAMALLLFSLIPPSALLAQRKVDPAHQGERILAIVPMVGDGKTAPKRPMFAPLTPDANGITGFRYTLSDDGRFALVEFTARHPKAFDEIRRANPAEVKIFSRNQATLDQAETEFRKLKANFNIRRGLGGGR